MMKAHVGPAIVALAVGTSATIGCVNLATAAGNNNPPPAGAILDLAGMPVPHDSPITYTVDFTANLAGTSISLAFREDPAFFAVTDVSVTDLTHPSGNLLLNGDFSLGTVGGTPVDWTFQNTFGADFEGLVQSHAASEAAAVVGSMGPSRPTTRSAGRSPQISATCIGSHFPIRTMVI
jgi:hypothetical protein